MKLLFDLYTSQGHGSVKYHGGGTYGQNLLIELLSSYQENLEVIVIKGSGNINSNLNIALDNIKPPTIIVSSESDVIKELISGDYDVFYTSMPYYLVKYKKQLSNCSTNILGTIHGLREIELSYDFVYRSYLRNPIAKIKQIIKVLCPKKRYKKEMNFYKEVIKIVNGNILTVSNHTKHQILNVFPEINPEKILVLNPVDKILTSNKTNDIKKYSLEKGKYFLLTSCDRPVKNAFRALAAFNDFPIRGAQEFKICCIGFRPHQIKKVKRVYKNILGRIVFLNYLDREELESIIKNAFCFIYPSISEGFGYPPLESMRNSVPVLASSHTAIPEVCGDAVLYFNPFSEREIANRISQIINDKDQRLSLITKGNERYIQYSHNIEIQIKKIIRFIIRS